MDNLKGKVLNSLKWVGGSTLLVQLISWGITIYVIRLLSPDDFGLMGIAFVFLGTLSLVSELGLYFAVIQKRNITQFQLRQVLGFVILGNSFFFTVLFFGAPYIAEFYQEVRLIPILSVLSFIFLLRPLYVIQEALITKEMNFKIKSIVNLAANMSATIATFILAIRGFGVWALVWNQLVLYVARVIGFNILGKGFILPTFYFKGASSFLAFGGYATGASFFRTLYFKLDVMIAGKYLNVGLIGFYTVALQLSSMILDKLSVVIPQVAFPAFSTLQDDPERLSKSIIKSVWLLHLISFPCFIGMAAIAPEIVNLFLGEKWQTVIVPMQILCLIMPLRILDILYYPAMEGRGRADICMATAVFASLVLGFGFFAGIRWGIIGLSLTWVIAYPIIYSFMLLNFQNILLVQASEILKSFIAPLISSLIMYVSITFFRHLLGNHVTQLLQLLILLFSGGMIFLLVMISVDRNFFFKLRNVVMTQTL